MVFLPLELFAQVLCYLPIYQMKSCLVLNRQIYFDLIQQENSILWYLLQTQYGHQRCNLLSNNESKERVSHKTIVLKSFGFITDCYKFEELVPAYPIHELRYLECINLYRPFQWKQRQYRIKHIGLFSNSKQVRLDFINQLVHIFQSFAFISSTTAISEYPEHIELLFQSMDPKLQPHLMISIWLDTLSKWYPLNRGKCEKLEVCIGFLDESMEKNDKTVLADLVQVKKWQKDSSILVVDKKHSTAVRCSCEKFGFEYFDLESTSTIELFLHSFNYLSVSKSQAFSCNVQ